MNLIINVITYIRSSYFENSKIGINLSTFDESYLGLSLNDILNFKDRRNEINTLSIHLSKDTCLFSLVMQFNNDNVGANGNYTIMLTTKEDNISIEKYIKDKLILRKYVFNKLSVDHNEMIVTPIFNERTFSYKDNHCFILMPFTESWSDRVWKHIGGILEKEDFSYTRADNLFGHNILEDIWIAINESSYIIADITARNPNVFYEIGIAHTLGKKVILLTQNVTDILLTLRIIDILFMKIMWMDLKY